MNDTLPDVYRIANISELMTPCLLVYPDIIRSNLAEMLRIAGGATRLRPHVKTHKCADIVRMALAMGINKHKCATLAEAEMLANCGAPDVLIAYPQTGPSIEKLLDLTQLFAQTEFTTVVDNALALRELAAVTSRRGISLQVLIDIDSGMHRTGIAPDADAVELAREIVDCSTLRLVGLHVYDGHNHQSDLQERQSAVAALMQPVFQLVKQLRGEGIPIDKVVCGGTPTFPVFAELQVPVEIMQGGRLELELSPGTTVLSDFNYGKNYRDMSGIRHAAMLLTRVISKPGKDLLTVDLGYKAVASDPPAGHRCSFPELPDVEQIQHSEEHLVLRTSAAGSYQVGDVLYAIPAHICPTVALHAQLQVVENGHVTGNWPVSARHRLYQANPRSMVS